MASGAANAENNAFSVLLIHPSKGLICEDDPNCHDAAFKLGAEQEIVGYARGKNLLISDMTSFGSFWRVREDIHIRASHDGQANRYTAVLTNTSSETVSGLTLALGDPACIESHDSPCEVTAVGNKIIFEQVTSGQVIHFTAVYSETFLPLILKN